MVGRKLQIVIAGRNPGPLYPQSGNSECEIAAYRCETSKSAVTLVFPTLAHDALCFQPLATHCFRKQRRFKHLLKTAKNCDREICTALRANLRKNRRNPFVFSILPITGLFSYFCAGFERLTR